MSILYLYVFLFFNSNKLMFSRTVAKCDFYSAYKAQYWLQRRFYPVDDFIDKDNVPEKHKYNWCFGEQQIKYRFSENTVIFYPKIPLTCPESYLTTITNGLEEYKTLDTGNYKEKH